MKKGITLIALIITTIILLILAGISITLVVGDNGILNKAQKSKTNTIIGDIKDSAEIIRGEYEIDHEGKNPTPRYIIERLIDDDKITEGQVINFGDETGIGLLDVEGNEVQISGRNQLIITDNESIFIISADGGIIGLKDEYSIIEGCVSYCSLNEITIPKQVDNIEITYIEDSAFEHVYNLKKVTMYDNIEYIGYRAFADCGDLNTIILSNNIERINESTFLYDHNLYEIVIPDSVTIIDSWAFEYCNSLQNIKFPDSLVEIGSEAFKSCNIYELNLPESLEYIGPHSFSNCGQLTELYIPENLTSIGTGAFTNCYNVNSIIVNENNPNYDSRNNCNALIDTNEDILLKGCTNTIIPNDIKEIADSAFYGSYEKDTISIPTSVVSIGSYAFEYTKLASIAIPDNVQFLGGGAFDGCTYLQEAVIGNGIKELNYNLFDKCYNLESVTLGSSVEKIDGYAFYYCTKLNNIIIPATVNYIGMFAFLHCDSLTTVTFENTSGWYCYFDFIFQATRYPTLTNPNNNGKLLNDTYTAYSWYKN